MVISDLDRKAILRVLNDVKPYIVEFSLLEQLNMQCAESSDSIKEFMTKLEHQEKRLDPVPRTDLRIYLGRLRKEFKQ
jgi:hypothetical protein